MIIQPFWAALQAGGFISTAAEGVGTYRVKGRLLVAVGCVSSPSGYVLRQG